MLVWYPQWNIWIISGLWSLCLQVLLEILRHRGLQKILPGNYDAKTITVSRFHKVITSRCSGKATKLCIFRKSLYAFWKLTVSPASPLRCPSPYFCLLESWQLPVSLTFFCTQISRDALILFFPSTFPLWYLLTHWWTNTGQTAKHPFYPDMSSYLSDCNQLIVSISQNDVTVQLHRGSNIKIWI